MNDLDDGDGENFVEATNFDKAEAISKYLTEGL